MPRCDGFQGRIPGRSTLVPLASILTLFFGVPPLLAAEPNAPGDSQPAGEEPVSAAALVKAMYDSQAWVDRAKSFSIRVERIIAYTEKGLRQWAQQPRRRNRRTDPIPKISVSEEEWAWDETRIRYSHQTRGGGASARIFDGKYGVQRSQSADGENYESVLHDKPAKYFEVYGRVWTMPWGPGGDHRFWWLPIDVDKGRADRYLAPEDFELADEEAVNGRDCRVVLSRAGHMRLHIGKSDGRLYRRTSFVVWAAAPGNDYLTLCRQIGGEQIKTLDGWTAWLESLEPAERQRALRKLAEAKFEFTRPSLSETLDDYREAAPGCWLPFRQTLESYGTQGAKPFLSMKTKLTVEQVQVNQPLAEELFEIE